MKQIAQFFGRLEPTLTFFAGPRIIVQKVKQNFLYLSTSPFTEYLTYDQTLTLNRTC